VRAALISQRWRQGSLQRQEKIMSADSKPARLRRPYRAWVIAAVCALVWGTATATAAPAQPDRQSTTLAAPTLLEAGQLGRLLQSQGNLYWLVNTPVTANFRYATVYVMAKTAKPGVRRVLYREYNTQFDALTFAKVDGQWRFYVMAYSAGHTRVVRLPLTGTGTGTTIATSPSSSTDGDLVTDGVDLFWADLTGVRAVPIRGGAIRTLAWTTEARKIGLQGQHLYYASGHRIYRVPKTGRPISTVVAVARSWITALHVPDSTYSNFIWGETNGTVKRRRLNGTVDQFQAPRANRSVTSVSLAGARVVWSDCATTGMQCVIRAGRTSRASVLSTNRMWVRDVQGDAQAIFWVDFFGMQRLR
jgi:hypothetical protein